LRSERSLIQTIGRAARNVNGKVVLYADRETNSIRKTVEETSRRREIQALFNKENGITPKTIEKRISNLQNSIWEADYSEVTQKALRPEDEVPLHERPALVAGLRKQMQEAASALDFERAAALRDRIRDLEAEQIRVG
jgi:excinuclease ABC subunit B